MSGIRFGDEGQEVLKLQENLKILGYYNAKTDGDFGPKTLFAVKKFQEENDLSVDGIAGINTMLKITELLRKKPAEEMVNVEICCKMFPHTPKKNIEENLPYVLEALKEAELYDKEFILMALSTIRAETESFLPISERESKYNTSPNGNPFDLYDKRKDLGNEGRPDGQKYRGRGFIQLTGKHNYRHYGEVLGIGEMLIEEPDMANSPVLASRLLVAFLKEKEIQIREALKSKNLLKARKLVNGGSHGYDRFSEAYFTGNELIA